MGGTTATGSVISVLLFAEVPRLAEKAAYVSIVDFQKVP